MMDWKKMLRELAQAGYGQVEIAAECGVAQSTVSGLLGTPGRKPRFDFGTKLVALHARACLRKPLRSGGRPRNPSPAEPTTNEV